MAVGLDHLLLRIDDMEAAVDFYQMVVGTTLASRLDAYGMMELRIGSAGIAVVGWTTPASAWPRPRVEGRRGCDEVVGLGGVASFASGGRFRYFPPA